MAKPKRTWTAGFKRDALALAKHGDQSVAQFERDLGLSVGICATGVRMPDGLLCPHHH